MAISRRSFLGTLGMGATAALVPYPRAWAAWEPPSASRAGFILLNSNENAYGPFPSVQAAASDGLRLANRYPFGQVDEFRELVASYHKVSTSQVVLGEGSTEVLRVAVDAFTDPRRKLVMALPTFEAPLHYAWARGAKVAHVPLTAHFAHDLDAMLAAARSGAGLIYLCNPNNPTASLTPRRDIEAFLKKVPPDTYVLIDEAYHHFVASPDYASFLDQPVEDPRLIVARTFSKVYGLAGLRLGYGIGAPQTIKKMAPCLLDDNANMVVLYCARAALQDETATRTAIQRNALDRAEFFRQAAARRLPVIPSEANFAMLHAGRPVRELIRHFRRERILVGRPFPPLEDYLRVSLGKPDEMQQFWAAWDKLPELARQ